MPAPDRAMFDSTVYPMLLRDCAFTACHGAEHRFLQVLGPGRVRLENAGSGPAREARERQQSYDRARSMLVAPGSGSIFQSPLLTKPLEVAAGGASHEGVDNFGRNVFQSAADPRYQLLVAWAQTALQPMAAATLPNAGSTALDGGLPPSGGAPSIVGMPPVPGSPPITAAASTVGPSAAGSAGVPAAPGAAGSAGARPPQVQP